MTTIDHGHGAVPGMHPATIASAAGLPAGSIDERVALVSRTNAAGPAPFTSRRLCIVDQTKARSIFRPSEVPDGVPSRKVTPHSGDGTANLYFVSGFKLDHNSDFAACVGGVRVNMPSYVHGQGYRDLNRRIPELIDRIEYKKGKNYADDGDFSAAGAAGSRYNRRIDAPIDGRAADGKRCRRALLAGGRTAGGDLVGAAEGVENYRQLDGIAKITHGDANRGYSLEAQDRTGTRTRSSCGLASIGRRRTGACISTSSLRPSRCGAASSSRMSVCRSSEARCATRHPSPSGLTRGQPGWSPNFGGMRSRLADSTKCLNGSVIVQVLRTMSARRARSPTSGRRFISGCRDYARRPVFASTGTTSAATAATSRTGREPEVALVVGPSSRAVYFANSRRDLHSNDTRCVMNRRPDGPASLRESHAVRSASTFAVDVESGLRVSRASLLVYGLNALDRHDDDITQYTCVAASLASRLRGEATPVNDDPFHPVEPHWVRASVAVRF